MMKNRYRGISVLVVFLMLVVSGCGRNGLNSEDEISVALSTENNDPDEKYKNYLQERIAEMIIQGTGCSTVDSDIDMSDDGIIEKVEISSGEYAFSEEEKETIIQYIENLAGNPNVEVVFKGESQDITTNRNEDSAMVVDGDSSTVATDVRTYARFSGCFTATVEKLLPDYYALPGKTIAVVHYFQDRPFLLRFQEDMTDKLIEGETYIFEFDTFDVEIPEDLENKDVSDYMYSIVVTNYRLAEEDEKGLSEKRADVEIVRE